jgi:hypothetical protein
MRTGTCRRWAIFPLLIVLAVLAGCGRPDMTSGADPTAELPLVAPTYTDCAWQRIGGDFEPVPRSLD